MTPPIPSEESLTVELKSDVDCLPDHELVAAVVCLANTEGGQLYLGVENDGTVTGLHPKHESLSGLAALIANRTHPAVSVRVERLDEEGKYVARIDVPQARAIVATSEGLIQRRRIMADGRPGCVPFYPHEHVGHLADLGVFDVSAGIVPEATLNDFAPLERVRLRQAIEQYGGDRALLALSDSELDGALGFVRRENGELRPTLAGLLFLGTDLALRDYVPTHEVAFQVLSGTSVRVNDFYRWPLVRAFERVMEQFSIRVVEEEIQVNGFRVPAPNYDRSAVREAFLNALIHRDYTQLGAVHFRWEDDGIVISNPGGFVRGVTIHNLLVIEPRPRNSRLADVAKRIGLVERTGRGVDLIYQGMLRYGRPPPDYSRSDAYSVVVRLEGGDADLGLLRLVVEQEGRMGSPLPLDTLIALSLLWRQRRLDITTLGAAMQRDEAAARAVLERLVEAGLVDARGTGRTRAYVMSPSIYREFGQPGQYVRQVGFDPIQQEAMIRQYIKAHGRITRGDVAELCRLGPQQATRLLAQLVDRGVLVRQGERKGAYYEAGPNI